MYFACSNPKLACLTLYICDNHLRKKSLTICKELKKITLRRICQAVSSPTSLRNSMIDDKTH